jgi:hypothetical protein
MVLELSLYVGQAVNAVDAGCPPSLALCAAGSFTVTLQYRSGGSDVEVQWGVQRSFKTAE